MHRTPLADVARAAASRTDVDIVCLGEPMLELNLQAPDATGRRVYLEAHGGDASNVAIAAARQGARVAMLTALGDDLAGASFVHLWGQEGVDCSAVPRDPDHPTGLYFVTHDSAGHHFSYLRRGSAASRFRLDAAARDVVERAGILFASGISLGIADRAADTVFEAIGIARQAGRLVAIDSNYRPKLWPRARAAAIIQQAMALSDIVFPGLEDIDMLFGLTDPDAIVDHCLSMGPRLVVLKMGSAGALLASPGARRRVAAFPCTPVDATGAGDTFCGSFLARFAQGATEEAAATYAACAAALATTGYGAVPPIPRRAAVLDALARTAR